MPLIPISRPETGDAEVEAAARVLRSGWLTQGPEVAAFEQAFAAQVGAPHACAASSCTSALHLALHGLGVGLGDEVVTVSHSFIATANAVRHCGAVPVFVDIRPDTMGMDPQSLAAAITSRTKAVLAVHQIGIPCDMAAITEIAARHDLPVVEDAACAIGSEILWRGEWQPIGRPHGTVACFSFHPRKVITCGEGGMLVTADPVLDARFRRLRQHAMDVPDTVRHGAPTVVFEHYGEVGFNYRMTDLQAAVGRTQLARLPDILARRTALAKRYNALIAESSPEIELPAPPSWARSNWQSYCVLLPPSRDQRRVMQRMLDQGVATRRGIMNAHREAPYAASGLSLPVSEMVQDHAILLPLYSQLGDAEQDRVVESLAAAMDQDG